MSGRSLTASVRMVMRRSSGSQHAAYEGRAGLDDEWGVFEMVIPPGAYDTDISSEFWSTGLKVTI